MLAFKPSLECRNRVRSLWLPHSSGSSSAARPGAEPGLPARLPSGSPKRLGHLLAGGPQNYARRRSHRGDADLQESGPPAEFVVKAGTKIPLSLLNSLNTKVTAEGDRVYLEAAFPIVQDGRIVVRKGSYVADTVTQVKRAGKVKGKAELFPRFDSLTLPNGVTHEFRSRPDSADGNHVDRQRRQA